MSEDKEKPIYIKGSAKEVVFNDGGTLRNLSVNVKQLIELAGGDPDAAGCDTEYLNLTEKSLKNAPDQYGNTHYLVLNTFRPDTKKGPVGAKPKGKVKDPEDKSDDLPF